MHRRLDKFPLGKGIPAHVEFQCLRVGLFGKTPKAIDDVETALLQWVTTVHSPSAEPEGKTSGKDFKQTALARVVTDMEAVHALLHFHGTPLILENVSPMAIAGRLQQQQGKKCFRNQNLVAAFCARAKACDPNWIVPDVPSPSAQGTTCGGYT